MKRYIQIAFALLSIVCFAACSGSDDTPGVPDGVLRITANKSSLTADGRDAVTFRAMYGSTDVSRSTGMHLIQVLNGTETELPAGVNTFTTTVEGSYTLKARYQDGDKVVESDNTVALTATPSGDVETQKYYLKMLAMQFTSTGCVNCPMMSSTLKLIREEQPGRLAVASFHLHYNGVTDPMYIKMATTYGQKLNVTGLPTCFINLNPAPLSSEKSSITGGIDNELKDNPGNCGVAINSSYNATSRELSVTAKVTSNVAEAYRYLILLVEDDIPGAQYGSDEADYRHNNVVRAVLSTNIYGERFNQGAALAPGVEATATRSGTIEANWNTEKMRVIVAALVTKDNGVTYVCSNVNECSLGGNADYLLINE